MSTAEQFGCGLTPAGEGGLLDALGTTGTQRLSEPEPMRLRRAPRAVLTVIEVVGGDSQNDFVNMALDEPLHAKVLRGQSRNGEHHDFPSNGQRWRGRTRGACRMVLRQHSDCSPGPTPSQIAAHSVITQSALLNTAVGTPPSVLVRDVSGTPVAGVTVTFAVTSGGGTECFRRCRW